MKKYILIIISLFLSYVVIGQTYDYDDIYFNPKTDKQKSADELYNESPIESAAVNAVQDTETYPESEAILLEPDYSYSARINRFHRSNEFGLHIADDDYTNIYYLGNGSYNIYVDDNYVNISNSPWYSPYYYSNFYDPFYYNNWSYNWGFNWGYGWAYNWGWGPYYNPYYNPYPCYYGTIGGGCYPPYYSPYNPYYPPYWNHYPNRPRPMPRNTEINRRNQNMPRTGSDRASLTPGGEARPSTGRTPGAAVDYNGTRRPANIDGTRQEVPSRGTTRPIESNETRSTRGNSINSMPARPVGGSRPMESINNDRVINSNSVRPSRDNQNVRPSNESTQRVTRTPSGGVTRTPSNQQTQPRQQQSRPSYERGNNSRPSNNTNSSNQTRSTYRPSGSGSTNSGTRSSGGGSRSSGSSSGGTRQSGGGRR